MSDKEEILLKWAAPEFIQYKRGWRWYVLAIIFYIGVVGYSVYAQDWYVIALATLLLSFVLLTKRIPKDNEYKLSQIGLYINGKLYPYNELHSFWLVLNADQKVLNIVFQKKYLPALTILFYGIDPFELKTVLSKYLPEQEDRTESLVEKLERYLHLN